jgi:hypothetical protein
MAEFHSNSEIYLFWNRSVANGTFPRTDQVMRDGTESFQEAQRQSIEHVVARTSTLTTSPSYRVLPLQKFSSRAFTMAHQRPINQRGFNQVKEITLCNKSHHCLVFYCIKLSLLCEFFLAFMVLPT